MIEVDQPRAVCDLTRRFFDWLVNDALPLWSTTGVDRDAGGFVERLTPDGELISDVRRARVVARQIYSFKTAGDLGWAGPSANLVRHGLSALLEHHLIGQDEIAPRYVPALSRSEGDFDLYDQAFVLFGLAHGYASSHERSLEAKAISILGRMREQWGHPEVGFVEHRPPRAPLKANPHMHLLEASLAWMDASASESWKELASEIVSLCLSRFIDPRSGGLHEYFDTEWNVLAGPAEGVIEPGHQAEWAWLLLRWQDIQPTRGLPQAAARLLKIAEEQGLEPRQHRLVNELNDDLSVRDARLRLWPQTERIKALIAFHRLETNEDRRGEIAKGLAQALSALLAYFDHPIRGSWWEHFDEAGALVCEPARASSLYHIMGAASELASFTGLRLG